MTTTASHTPESIAAEIGVTVEDLETMPGAAYENIARIVEDRANLLAALELCTGYMVTEILLGASSETRSRLVEGAQAAIARARGES